MVTSRVVSRVRAVNIVVITAAQSRPRLGGHQGDHRRHQVQLLTSRVTQLSQNLRSRALNPLLHPQNVTPALPMFEQVVFRLKRKFARFTRIRPFICVRPTVSPSITVSLDLDLDLRRGGRAHHAAHAVLESVPHILA